MIDIAIATLSISISFSVILLAVAYAYKIIRGHSQPIESPPRRHVKIEEEVNPVASMMQRLSEMNARFAKPIVKNKEDD